MTYYLTIIYEDGTRDTKHFDNEEAYASAYADYWADCYDPRQYTRQVRGGDHAVFQHGDFRTFEEREE